MKNSFLRWIALALLAVACGKTEERTDIVLEIQSNFVVPDEMDALRVRLSTDQSPGFFDRTYLIPSEITLPRTMTLVPTADQTHVTVEITGLLGQAKVVTRAATMGFVKGKSKYLLLQLDKACVAVTCDAPQTCQPGGVCGPIELNPVLLPDFDRKRDAAAPLPYEAGVPDTRAVADATADGLARDAHGGDGTTDGIFQDGSAPDVPQGKVTGATCVAAGDCRSGFCVDGVCCESECTDICRSCNVPGLAGRCALAPPGTDPRENCAKDNERTCKNTGACDGKGACQKYPAGTLCFPQACSGFVHATAARCDGAGNCSHGPTLSCAPYLCDEASGECLGTCTGGESCLQPAVCQAGSCGKKPLGSTCKESTECHSGFCADGVCCQSACADSCRSCAVEGSKGACIPTPAGSADPKAACKADTASACGGDGSCDGAGRCQKAPMGTPCAEAACAGAVALAPKFCDGLGSCLSTAQQNCEPYACVAAGCKATCASPADCAPDATCVAGECVGKKSDGSPCADGTECKSSVCADGVCCATACDSPCASCNQAGRKGTCSPLPDKSAPKGAGCAKEDPSTCGNDGTCDGTGSCRLYGADTVCKAPSCAAATKTLAFTCDGKRACVGKGTQSCAPYQCSGMDCAPVCRSDADCVAPNPCVNGSCGKKPLGSACSVGTDCQSSICAQGVCCSAACDGACQSCALPGGEGTCRPVPAGKPDPKNTCTKSAPETCGLDGTCDGAGACHAYEGNVCGAAACAGSTLNQAGSCAGGQCSLPRPIACAPYSCDPALLRCKSTCTQNTDCDSLSYCRSGVCVPKGKPGDACQAGGDCGTGNCVDGVCCDTGCSGLCQSCRVPGLLGTCSPIPAGSPSEGDCPDEGSASCARNGKCDGRGACQLYSSGTVCSGATCPAGSATRTLASLCDGQGRCVAGAAQTCSPYQCNGATNDCYSSCTPSSAECLSPNLCVNGSCGKKPSGQACSSASECSSGYCEQGVCCGGPCRDSCKSCALPASPGTCTAVPAGQADPQAICKDEGVASCGNTGLCNGAAACQKYASGTRCATTCSTTSATVTVSTCNGTGTCVAGASVTCSPYSCDAGGCKSICSTTTDCAAGYICQNKACVRGVENCMNGTDDDGDGDVDCADSDCSAYQCVTTPPDGFKGPTAVFEGAFTIEAKCTGAYSDTYLDAYGAPTCDWTCSACACGSATGAKCEGAAVAYGGSLSLACTVETQLTPGTCVVGSSNSSKMQITPGTATGGACPATGGKIDPKEITWDKRGLVCGNGGNTGGGCATGFSCVPKPPSPLAGMCVIAEGDVACPGTGYTSKRTFWSGKEILDRRDCTNTCACDTPTGTTCSGTAALYSSRDCSGLASSATVPMACQAVSSVGSFRYTAAPPSGGVCKASGTSTKSGGCYPESVGMTICCGS